MECPQVADGGMTGSLEHCSRYMMNKQSGRTDKALTSCQALVEALINPHHRYLQFHENITVVSDFV